MAGSETVPFSQLLRDATDVAHQEAERSVFVVDLVDGTLPRPEFVRFVRQLHAVYEVLEDATGASDDPVIAPLLGGELSRTAALTADLDYLAGPGWRDELATIPATDAYCDRIRARGLGWSGGLVAHHYVRYMGDLSGGQILGRVVARVYGLPDGLGTAAYRFDEIASPKQYKDAYRARLDALPWSERERERVAAEAIAAFGHSTALFRELSATRVG